MTGSLALILLVALVVIGLICLPLSALLVPRGSKWRRKLVIGLTLFSLAVIAFIAVTIDDAWGFTQSWIVTAILAVICSAVSVPMALLVRSRILRVIVCGLLAGVLVLHFVDLSPAKPFRRFFASIHEGMTRSEVKLALRREFPDRGRYRVPVEHSDDPNDLQFTLDPTDQAYNAEIVSVELRDGKVVSKDYWPD